MTADRWLPAITEPRAYRPGRGTVRACPCGRMSWTVLFWWHLVRCAAGGDR